MGKNKITVMIIAITMLICITGCQNNKSKNELGGNGKIKQADSQRISSVIYDDDKIYVPVTVIMDSVYRCLCYCYDMKTDTYNINCYDAACRHSDSSCKAWLANMNACYIALEGEAYKAVSLINIYDVDKNDGKVIKCSSGKTEFENVIPDGISKEHEIEDTKDIIGVRNINDNYIIIYGHRHNYLLDKDWNVLYWHEDLGKDYWGLVYDNCYYYIDDMYRLSRVDLETRNKSRVDLGSNILYAAYMEDVGIFYTDEFYDLFKYDINSGEITKIRKDVMIFSIFEDKIYFESGILDKDGNLIGEKPDVINPHWLQKVNDRLYMFTAECAISMKMDGSDLRVVESR